MDLEQKLIAKIRQIFPDFKFSKTTVLTHGWNDVVVIADDGMVFSFPKDDEDSRTQLQKELRLLPLIKRHVSLPIPDFSMIAPDKSFAGSAYIPGIPLTSKVYAELGREAQEGAATTVGLFLKDLHAIPVAEARACEVSDARSVEEANAWFREVRQVIYQATRSEEERSRIDELLGELDSRPTSVTRVLTHNDLSPDHVFFDQGTQKVSGIIDFGDAKIDDPAVDFGKLWGIDKAFVLDAIKAYGNSDQDLATRAHGYYIQSCLNNLYWGIEKKNDLYLARGRRIFD